MDNNSFNASGSFRNAEKTTNSFAINLAQYEDILNSVGGIEIIANQCPTEGGVAVFKARTLMSMLTGSPYEAIDDCPATKKESQNKEGVSKNEGYRVFPNPADGFINILSNDKEVNGFYQMYNAQGQLAKHGGLVATRTRISTLHLPSGLYIIKVNPNNDNSSSHNVIVIH